MAKSWKCSALCEAVSAPHCLKGVLSFFFFFFGNPQLTFLCFALQKAIAPASCLVLLNEHPLLKYSTSRSVAKHPVGESLLGSGQLSPGPKTSIHLEINERIFPSVKTYFVHWSTYIIIMQVFRYFSFVLVNKVQYPSTFATTFNVTFTQRVHSLSLQV